MKTSRRTYDRIANIFTPAFKLVDRGYSPRGVLFSVAGDLADILKESNTAFDTERFLFSCTHGVKSVTKSPWKIYTMRHIVDFGTGGELECEVTYTYSPATRDVLHMPNGDPGYPGSPAEFEVQDICIGNESIWWMLRNNEAFVSELFTKAAEAYDEGNCDA